MTKSSIPESVAELIEPVIRAADMELVDVEYKKLGRSWTLRIYIDKETGITLDDCQKISRQISDMIEIDELIPMKYVLEVSSPGLDRPLKREKDFLRFKHKRARVQTDSPIGERRRFTGTIEDFKDKTLYLNVDGQIVEIPFTQIAQAKLVVEI